MALTVASLTGLSPEPQTIAQTRAKFVEITGDSSYDAGGEALTPAMLGMTKILLVLLAPSGGYVPEYIPSTGKVMVRWSAGSAAVLAEITAATNLSAVTFRGIVFGL